MAVQVVMRITFLLLLTYELAEAASLIAKLNCSDSCGNIYIPYPFGKTTSCYLNDWFKIVCNETGDSPKAFLPELAWRSWKSILLIRSPFFFSSYQDRFISVGCDNLVIMTGINPMVVVGCKSNCVDKSMIDDSELEHCSGFNCCMTTIPFGIQVFNASFIRGIKEEIKTSEECKFAFLADDKWLNSSTKDLSYYVQFLEYVPVVLEWTASYFTTMDSTELLKRNSEGYTTDYGAEYYYCLKDTKEILIFPRDVKVNCSYQQAFIF
ncbi:wall-associated receptor kinase-like 8 [Castanea sativa]|uniref:wall-associated receptor kinase-like 8 n=1 Tax=Castanea sativa TaxID=21020 RepID=UPI003F64A4A1